MRRTWPALVVLSSFGCNVVLGLDGLEADRTTGGNTVGANGPGGSSAGGDTNTAGNGSGGCADVCGTPGCGECPATPTVVTASGYAIDAREVTNGEYAAFLSTQPSLLLAPGDFCMWNDSYQPGDVSEAADALAVAAGQPPHDPADCAQWAEDAGESAKPVACVDWCDAAAYCAWAGRRLCAMLGGAPGDNTTMDQTLRPGTAIDGGFGSNNEWQLACQGEEGLAYPYGDTYDDQRCNDDGNLPKASFATCSGGYRGLFDMSGNVAEWEASCTDYNGPEELQNCMVRGGSWFESSGLLRCDGYHAIARFGLGNGVGFRCCSR